MNRRSLFCLLTVCVLPGSLRPRSFPHGAPLTATGAFFALSVADLETSTRWYSETFDMSVVMRSPRQDGSAVTVLEGHGLMVELIQLDQAAPLGSVAPAVQGPLFVHGLAKAGVLVDDFPAALAALKEKNVAIAYGPFAARPGQKANAIIRDNAGNLIQIIGR